MSNDKVNAYIGFAVKKGSVVFGLDRLAIYRKKVHLILYSSDISENSFKKLTDEALRLNTKCKKYDSLDEVLKRNCKALGITDKQLAVAIDNNLL